MLHAVLLLHPIARKMKAAGGLGSFYVLGRKAMAVFDPSVMTWTTLAKPPDHGMNAAATVYDSKIYVSGGYASSEKRLGRHSQKTPLVPKRSIRPEHGVTQSLPCFSPLESIHCKCSFDSQIFEPHRRPDVCHLDSCTCRVGKKRRPFLGVPKEPEGPPEQRYRI